MKRSARALLVCGAVSLLGACGLLLDALARAPRLDSAYLAAFVFVFSTCLGGLGMLAMSYAVAARWFVVLRRSCEALSAPLIALPLLFVPIALRLHALFPWANSVAIADTPHARADASIFGRAWLSPGPFLVRAFFYLALALALAELFRRVASAEDRAEHSAISHARTALGAVAIPVTVLLGTFAAFDWLSAAAPGLQLTSIGFYLLTGGFAAALGLLAAVFAVLRRSGLLPREIGHAHAHALGRLLLSAVCLWAYIAVSQLVIVWSADMPRENALYLARYSGPLHSLAWLLIFGHFLLPFSLLLSRRFKQQSGLLGILGGWLVLMHAVDVYWLLAPASPRGQALLDLAPFLFLGGLALCVGIARSAARPLVAANDPEFGRSLRYRSP